MSVSSQDKLTVGKGNRSCLQWVRGLSGPQRGMKGGANMQVEPKVLTRGLGQVMGQGACHGQGQKTGKQTRGRAGRSVAEVPSLSSRAPAQLSCFYINPGASGCPSVMSPPCPGQSRMLSEGPGSGGQSPCSSGGQGQMAFSLTLLISLPRDNFKRKTE